MSDELRSYSNFRLKAGYWDNKIFGYFLLSVSQYHNLSIACQPGENGLKPFRSLLAAQSFLLISPDEKDKGFIRRG
jgi:hypothetical protein